MGLNRLKMNDVKMEYIQFGSRQQLAKCTCYSIDVNGTIVSRSNFIKYLGAILDRFLSMKQDIKQKCKTTMWNLYGIKHVGHCLTREVCHTLVLGLVISHLDYANIIFLKLPDSTIAMLQQVQNIATRLVLDKEQGESTTECLKILHWLPIKARVEHKAIMLVHKSLQGQALDIPTEHVCC